MTKIIGFDSLTTEQIRDAKKLVMQNVLQAPEINNLIQIFPGIVGAQKIGLVGEFGLMGKAAQGCAGTPQTASLGVNNDKYWSVKAWEIFLRECWKDYEATLGEYSFKKGISRADLTGTDIMVVFVDRLTTAIKKMIIQKVFFNDTAAAPIGGTPSGNLTAGTDETFFTLFDGLWKQAFTIGTDHALQKVAIAANAEATYALQKSALTPTLAWGYLESMILAAKTAVRYKEGVNIMLTQYFYDMACKYVRDKSISDTYINMVDGIGLLKVDGIPVVPQPIMTEIIDLYYNTGTAWYRPHRGLLTYKSNLGVAVPGNSIIEDITLLPNPYDEYFYIKGGDSMDAKIIDDDDIVVAF